MLRLTLVRHGATVWNETGRYQGWSDPPLSERGRADALRLGERLRSERLDRVITSDLARARETAALALPDVEVSVDTRLRELHFGAWEGLTYAECAARDGDRMSRWMDDPLAVAPPDGETTATLQQRAAHALADLPGEGSLLWVTHAGFVHAVLAHWMGVSLRQTFALHLSACGLSRAEIHPPGVRILCVNDTAHLDRDRHPQPPAGTRA